jgi:aspartyl-tRNA(Asn)/glutamyl-tRNA(Gln) amidotransferase subunit C
MTGFNQGTVKRLARLARLALTDAEVAALVPELSAIVRHVDAMGAVDTAGIAPMVHGHPWGAVLHRPAPIPADGDTLGRGAIAQSAGFNDDDGTVSVPKVIE